jgi:hypothetical protein
MTHQRVRTFNTKDTYPEQRLDNDLCQVVVAKGTLVFRARAEAAKTLRLRRVLESATWKLRSTRP